MTLFTDAIGIPFVATLFQNCGDVYADFFGCAEMSSAAVANLMCQEEVGDMPGPAVRDAHQVLDRLRVLADFVLTEEAQTAIALLDRRGHRAHPLATTGWRG